MRLPLLLKFPACRLPSRLRRQRAQQCCTSTSSPLRSRRLGQLEALPASDLHTFREIAFKPELPYRFEREHFLDALPAVRKWFIQASSPKRPLGEKRKETHDQNGSMDSAGSNNTIEGLPRLNTEYLARFGDTVVPMELFLPDVSSAASPDSTMGPSNAEDSTSFQRLEAPLTHFLSLHQMQERADASRPSPQAYIAQAPLASLPQELQADLPTPEPVLKAGKGDIYDSSIWLGRAPTYTPLHKDPNPNLFVQLAGRKVIRIFAPDVGRELFQEASKITGLQEGSESMMSGHARRQFENIIWGDFMENEGSRLGHEATLGPGDAVFVPKSWWHSIKGIGNGVVGSVNWWFR